MLIFLTVFKNETIELNFDFNFNKENINTTANFSSSFFNEMKKIQILPNFIKNEKNTTNNFENYPFEELIKYDNSKKENIPFGVPDCFQNETTNNTNNIFIQKNLCEAPPQTLKTPFVFFFLFIN